MTLAQGLETVPTICLEDMSEAEIRADLSYLFDKASQVLIAGDFNNWSPDATVMQQGRKEGEWRMSLPLQPGPSTVYSGRSASPYDQCARSPPVRA